MPTITTTDEYERMLAIVERGQIPAAIPAVYHGTVGLWTNALTIEPGKVTNDTEALAAAIIAIRVSYRSARAAGATPLV